MKLSERVRDDETKARIVADCTKLMDEQVAAKNGLSGLAMKTAYRALKGIGPGYIPRVLHGLLPKAVEALDPMWDEGLQMGNPVEHLSFKRSETADVLLSITDNILSEAKNKIAIATYKQVRKSVKGDVEEAVPGLAQIINTHINV